MLGLGSARRDVACGTALLTLVTFCCASGVLADGAGLQPTPSVTGLSGLIRTPTADTMSSDRWRLQYTAPITLGNDMGDSAVTALSLSVVPRTEVAFSLGAQGQGIDLTYHAKVVLLEPRLGRPGFAVGVVDGNHAQGQREGSRFAVATLPVGDGRASVSAGVADGRISGLFGGVAYEPWRWLTLQAEYDTRRVNTGAVIRAGEQAYLRVADTRGGPMIAVGGQFGIEYPAALSSDEVRRIASGVPGGPNIDSARSDLVEIGFEDVRVRIENEAGTRRMVASFENRRFTLRQEDGIRAGLAILANRAPTGIREVAVELSRRGIVVGRATLGIQEALQGEAGVVKFETLPLPSGGSIEEETGVANRSALHADLVMGIGLKTVVGSEIGYFRMGVLAQPEVEVPVGRGLLVDVRGSLPVCRDLLADRPSQMVCDRALLALAFRPAGGCLAQISAGRYPTDADGVVLEVARPIGNAGIFRLVGGHVRNDALRSRVYAIGEYWHAFPGGRVQARLFGGQFLTGDRGLGLDVFRFYGDARVGLGYRNTGITGIALVSLSLPLSPRRQPLRPGTLRIKTPDFLDHSVKTTTEHPNYIARATAAAGELLIGQDLITTFLDRGRLLPGSMSRRER